MKTKIEAAAALKALRPFIGAAQLHYLGDLCRGEERQWYFDKLCELAERVRTMPATYEQDGLWDEAVASLHYFAGGRASWWITEIGVYCGNEECSMSELWRAGQDARINPVQDLCEPMDCDASKAKGPMGTEISPVEGRCDDLQIRGKALRLSSKTGSPESVPGICEAGGFSIGKEITPVIETGRDSAPQGSRHAERFTEKSSTRKPLPTLSHPYTRSDSRTLAETSEIIAFGLADLFGDGGEMGYISIPELLAAGAELDFHFEPTTVRDIRTRQLVTQP